MTSTSSLPWVEPGAFEEAPGVFRIPLPLPNDGLKAVNVYAISTPSGLVCVDAGWAIPQSRELLASSLASVGFEVSDITRFLVTHVHRDHYTQAVTVRREFGARVGLGLGEKPTLDRLQDATRAPLGMHVAQLREAGAADWSEALASHVMSGKADPSHWESPDDWMRAGPVDLGDRVLDAVETPGHTAGHLVFHDVAGGLLFAGDHVLPTITPSIGFEPVLSDNPLGAFLRSLQAVRERPDALLLPAHGPVAPSAHARVDELVAHHGQRLDQTEAAVRAGASTGYEAAGRLGWTRRQHQLADLDLFNGMLAVFETVAHLDLLVAQGRLTSQMLEGVRHYAEA